MKDTLVFTNLYIKPFCLRHFKMDFGATIKAMQLEFYFDLV